MWAAYTAVGAIAAATCVVAMWSLGRAAPRLGLVDHPSGRKQHKRGTPLVGGVAILLAVIGTLALAALADPRLAGAVARLAERPGFIMGALLLVAVGALDDHSPIKARYKLGFQLACCMAAVLVDRVMVGDVGIGFGGFVVSLGPLVAPFTILVMLTILNGMNMVDGVDGLAGGMAFVCLLLMAKASTTAGFVTDGVVLCALLGALAAFLSVNFPFGRDAQARVFLGDSGSLLLGFVLAYFAVYLSALPHRVFRPSTALWFFFIPVADAVLLYLRRMLRDGAPFSPGRDHIHHILLRRWSARTVTWGLVGATAAMAGLSYWAERAGVDAFTHVAGWVLLFLLFAAATQRSWTAAWLRSRRAERRVAPPPPPPFKPLPARRAA